MKHIFVINPVAGKKDSSQDIIEALHKYDDSIDYEVYITKYKGDTQRFVKERCMELNGKEARFYACGGDGTLNGVLNGIIGFDNVSLTHYPVGSGNDFIKYFKGKDFSSLDNLINGIEEDIDVLKVNDKYSLNITNFGLDAKVCYTMEKLRRKKILGGKRAYANAVLYSLIVARKNYCKISLDGTKVIDGKILLCAVANGKVYGGGYWCAPEALVNDSVFDFVLMKAMPLLKSIRLLKVYKKGKHLECKALEPYLVYLRGKHIEASSLDGIAICLDGETEEINNFTIDIMPAFVKFVVPQEA